ncbi:hypothetical protein ACFQLX_14205 [Streptomyces polyrhachis]|uniref:Uncharacterized protein n=1 Tax=Streptomyces polyrhachis TaxID=1282885 RepID=A0ABW2GKC9_9ACTN
MRHNSPVKGHHGLGARGQGKPLYFHGQPPNKQGKAKLAEEQAKARRAEEHQPPYNR